MQPRDQHPWESLLIVAESGNKLFCLMVDELIGKQEVVIKSLGEGMRNIPAWRAEPFWATAGWA